MLRMNASWNAGIDSPSPPPAAAEAWGVGAGSEEVIALVSEDVAAFSEAVMAADVDVRDVVEPVDDRQTGDLRGESENMDWIHSEKG